MSSTEKQPSHVNAPFVDSRTLNINRGVPNVDGYFPLNEPAVGTIYTDVVSDIPIISEETLCFPENLPKECEPSTVIHTTHYQRCHVQE